MTAQEFNIKLLGIQHKLRYYAMHLTRDHERARDLVQDTLLNALVYKDKFDGANLQGWTMTIMHNFFTNSCNKDNRKKMANENIYFKMYIEGYKYKEIMSILNASYSHVNYNIYLTRKKIINKIRWERKTGTGA
jgi:RNA polymerase sigma-70 factor (ECF subfamily)